MRKINFSDFQTLIWPKYPIFLCYITLKPVQKKLIFQVLQKTKSWSAHNFQKRTEPKFPKKYHFFLYTEASYFTMCALCSASSTSCRTLLLAPGLPAAELLALVLPASVLLAPALPVPVLLLQIHLVLETIFQCCYHIALLLALVLAAMALLVLVLQY